MEAIYQDRDSFAEMVRKVASPDLGRMGMEILSFTIKDVVDKVKYLDSLGKTQTAVVKRDAAIGIYSSNFGAVSVKIGTVALANEIGTFKCFRYR